MKFIEARFRNFRLLHDLEISFSTNPRLPLTVLRAENDTGKTTILHALQWVLFGDDVLPLRGKGYRIHPLDWNVADSKTVDIEVELKFEHTFERYDRQGSSIKTTEVYLARRTAKEEVLGPNQWNRTRSLLSLYKQSDRGTTPVPNAELSLRQIMGSNLKDIFFLEGDRALTFITSEISDNDRRKLVRSAIRDMLAVEILEKTRDRVDKTLNQIRTKNRDFPEAKEINEAGSCVTELKKKIRKKEEELKGIDSDLAGILPLIRKTDGKIKDALVKGNKEKLKEELSTAQSDLAGLRKRSQELASEHSELFRAESLNLHLLVDYLQRTGRLLEKLKQRGRIPRSALPILREYLQSEECICRRPLVKGSGEYKHVEELIARQESASEIDDRLTNLLYIAKEKLRGSEQGEPKWQSEVRRVVGERNDVEKNVKKLEARVKLLETTVAGLPDTDISFLTSQLTGYQKQKTELDRRKGGLETELPELKRALRIETNHYEKLLNKSKASKRLQSHYLTAADVFSVIDKVYKAIETSEIPDVSETMNRFFMDMIRSDPEQNAIIRRAEVTKDYDITVYGPNERILNPDNDLNGAARRALTLSFVLALTRVSGVAAPNVIDTPLGMMDPLIKQSVLATLVSNSVQPILFLTRSEIRDCEGLLDENTGLVATLVNTAHYPMKLKNKPSGGSSCRAISCSCSHRQFCDICELIDSTESNLQRRIP